MFLADICHIPVGTVRCAVRVVMLPTFFVDQCMYNNQKPSKSYAKPSYELHVS